MGVHTSAQVNVFSIRNAYAARASSLLSVDPLPAF